MKALQWWHRGWAAHRSRALGVPNPHQPTGLEARILTTVAEIPAELWDACGGGLFLSRPYLAALEAAPPENLRSVYVCLLDKGLPAAIAHFQILRFEPALQRRLGVPGSFHRRVHDALTSHLFNSALICGNALLSGEHAFAVVPGVDQRRVVRALAEVAQRIRREERGIGAIVVKDFRLETERPDQVLSEYGFFSFDAGPNLVIPVRPEWKTFEDYVASMKGKYRRRVEGALKKGRGLKRRSLSADELHDRADELARLYEMVASAADFRPFRLNPLFLAELKEQLDAQFACDAWFDGDRLVAFTTRLFDGATMEGYVHGLDTSANRQWDLYQNILLDDVREAIARGSALIQTGRTSVGMKSAVGATPDPLTCWLRASGLGTNHLVPAALRMVRPSTEPVRNPFDA